jgi:hypothetical protein
MEVSGQLHGPAALSPRKETLVSIEQEAGWAPEPVWALWWREKSPAPAGTRTPNNQARSPAHWALPALEGEYYCSKYNSAYLPSHMRFLAMDISVLKGTLTWNEKK